MSQRPGARLGIAGACLVLLAASGCGSTPALEDAVEPEVTAPEAPEAPEVPEASGRAEPTRPEEARRVLDEGIAAVYAGEFRRGLELCEQALAHAGEDDALRAEAYRWLIHGSAQDRDPERALQYFAPAIELLPDDPWIRYSQGVALGTIGRFEDAILALGEALRLDPTQVKALQWRAQYQYETLQYAGAIEDCTRLLEVLDQTSDATLAEWGGNRAVLVRDTLEIRAGCYDASGQHDLARQDRERRILNDR